MVSDEHKKQMGKEENITDSNPESNEIRARMQNARKLSVFVNELKGKTIGGISIKVNPYA